MMRAVTLKGFGGVEMMTIGSLPKPVIARPTDILVRVKATAVNRADTMQRKGLYPPPKGESEIMGLEAAGVVEEIGADVRNVSPGDRVMGLLSGGGYAEFVTAHSEHFLKVPENLNYVEGAAIMEVFLTAWQCLKFNADVNEGDHVLVHAGASGVGTAACQLCRSLGAISVTTSSASKVEECTKFANFSVSRTPDEDGSVFAAKVAKAVGRPNCINAIIDPVFGGRYLQEDGEVLALDATVVILAFMGGKNIDGFNPGPFFSKRGTIRFSTLRSRSDEYKSRLCASLGAFLLPRLCSGEIRPVVSSVYPLEEISKAHTEIEANNSVGKIVVEL